MPWKETEPMTERMKFMMDWESGLFGLSELCVRYGVSRKTGYKWVRRWEFGGAEGLCDRSRAPRGCPHRTSREVEEKIVGLRGQRPNWGPVTLRLRLRREEPEVSWPAAATIGGILKRRGLSQPRRRRRRAESLFGNPERLQTQGPHQVPTADFKGQFRTGDGRYCYPLTIQDHYSRYALCCEALEEAKTPAEVYRPSERSYPRRLPPLEYPGHYEARRVNLNGYVKLHGRRVFLSEVLEHETVGLEEVQDGVWSIYPGEYLLGRWDRRNDTIRG